MLIVDQVQPAILQRTAVRFDLAKHKGVKRTSIFRADFNDRLTLNIAFLDGGDFGGERPHGRAALSV